VPGGVEAEIREFAVNLERLGWRGLLLAHHEDYARGALEALRILGVDPGDCLAVADRQARERLSGHCGRLVPPARYQEALGSESRVAVVAVKGLLRPNVLAAAAETVVEGGILLVGADPPNRWNPGPPGGTGLYARYLLETIMESGSHLIVNLREGRVVSRRIPGEPAPPRRPPQARPQGIPAALASRAATQDQLNALVEARRVVGGRGRTLLVLGDRGRGKSFLLGLTLALAIHWRQAGRAHVVAPHPSSASSLFKGLLGGLEALGYSGIARVRREGGWVTRVWGPWFSVFYQPPDSADPAPLLVVDEAAAVGVARIRRLSWRSGRVLLASTIHGYEGSGRALVHMLEPDLPRPLVKLELSEPIRYRRGDPLEKWVMEAFHLDAEPPIVNPEEALGAECRIPGRARIAGDRVYTRRLLGILAQAHYRFEPDYILVILESGNHEVVTLETPQGPVAAADIAFEEAGLEEAARLGLKTLSIHAPQASELRSARIVRIAVAPNLQRRGLGLRLLSCVESLALQRGVDVATSIFSRHDVLGFWAKAGYRLVYVSPRYNRATGEKNVAVAKPLSKRARGVVGEASSNFRIRFLLSLSSIYRDIDASRAALMLSVAEPAEWEPLRLTSDMSRRLEKFIEGCLEVEQAFDAVWAAAVNCLARLDPSRTGLDGRELEALTARILQGKPLNEVAYILAATTGEAGRISSEAARKLLRACRG
jgi:tRNA(Met) cytidine acetyltransferase